MSDDFQPGDFVAIINEKSQRRGVGVYVGDGMMQEVIGQDANGTLAVGLLHVPIPEGAFPVRPQS